MDKMWKHPVLTGLVWLATLFGGLLFLGQGLGMNAFSWWTTTLGSWTFIVMGLLLLMGPIWLLFKRMGSS